MSFLGRHGGASVSGEYAKLVSGLAHPTEAGSLESPKLIAVPGRASYDFR